MILSLVMAGLAGYLMWMFGRSLEQQYQPGQPISVLVANRSLQPRARLKKGDLIVRSIPENYVHPTAIRQGEFLDVENQVLANGLVVGQPLLWSDIEGNTDQSRSLGDYLKDSERALTIRADSISSAGGNLRPNDRVDVLATLSKPRTGEEVMVSLLQNVTVLATGRRIGNSRAPNVGSRKKGSHETVTLLLHTAEEAQLLSFAHHKGNLTLVVRNPNDIESSQPEPVGYTAIFGEERKQIQARRDKRIKILRAGAQK